MSAAISALVVGTVLAIGALAFVLYPLFCDALPARNNASRRSIIQSDDLAIAALREIEFDRATGKLSDADYAQLKAEYTRQALAGMRQAGQAVGGSSEPDEVEAVIRAYRAERPACLECGPRPEPDAAFCSNCGRYLRSTCEGCGRRVEEIGARFCAACGHRLAA